VLTSDEAYISERYEALADARGRIAAIKNLISDNTHQQIQMLNLETLLADRITPMHGKDEVLRIVGRDAVGARIAAHIGHGASVRIYDLTSEMKREELRLLKLRRAYEQRRHENNLTVLNAAVVMSA
jgi:CHASE3 domain sensor protein